MRLPAGEPEAAEILACERTRLEQAGIEVQATVRTGHPADEIVAFATANEAELLILGSRPAANAGPGFSGSVASKVARYSPSSVLIGRDGLPVRSVVLGYDASPDADAAVSLVAGLPFRARPWVAVCTTFEVDAPFSSGIAPTLRAQVWSTRHEVLREARQAAEAIAAEAAGRLREVGLEATTHSAHGRPSEQLTVLAAEVGADLIVVGSRGLSGVDRFLLGSTSGELVALAPTSLLVARS
jgi:nucleotide-binding universal stress UspA family protein